MFLLLVAESLCFPVFSLTTGNNTTSSQCSSSPEPSWQLLASPHPHEHPLSILNHHSTFIVNIRTTGVDHHLPLQQTTSPAPKQPYPSRTTVLESLGAATLDFPFDHHHSLIRGSRLQALPPWELSRHTILPLLGLSQTPKLSTELPHTNLASNNPQLPTTTSDELLHCRHLLPRLHPRLLPPRTPPATAVAIVGLCCRITTSTPKS